MSVGERKVQKYDNVIHNAGAIIRNGRNWLETWSMMNFLTCVVEPSGSATAILCVLVSVLHVELQYTYNTSVF